MCTVPIGTYAHVNLGLNGVKYSESTGDAECRRCCWGARSGEGGGVLELPATTLVQLARCLLADFSETLLPKGGGKQQRRHTDKYQGNT